MSALYSIDTTDVRMVRVHLSKSSRSMKCVLKSRWHRTSSTLDVNHRVSHPSPQTRSGAHGQNGSMAFGHRARLQVRTVHASHRKGERVLRLPGAPGGHERNQVIVYCIEMCARRGIVLDRSLQEVILVRCTGSRDKREIWPGELVRRGDTLGGIPFAVPCATHPFFYLSFSTL